MKIFTPTPIFLLCVSILSATGSYSRHERPLQVNAKAHSQGQLDPHKIHKRQDDPEDVCTMVAFSAICTTGYYQEYARVAQYSNRSELAQRLQEACRYNSMEQFCGAISNDLVTSTGRFCQSSDTTCTSECRNHLTNVRNQLSCCISVFNVTASGNDVTPFAYSLWSGCGVEPVTQECPSTVTLTPIQGGPTLDETASRIQEYSVFCRQQYVEDIQNRLSATASGCPDIELTPDGLCNANRFGTYCTDDSSWFSQNLTAAVQSCENTSTCDPLCIDTLNNITNTVGCCFTDRYNTTPGFDWLSYEFWSRCSLESPGSCEEFLNNDSPFNPNAAVMIKASGIAITFVVTIAVMLL